MKRKPKVSGRHRFIDFKELGAEVPYSKRRLHDLVKDGTIPSIRLPRSRKLLFDWDAVANALRRHTQPTP